MKKILVVVLVIILAVLSGWMWSQRTQPVPQKAMEVTESPTSDKIKVNSPLANGLISSPLTIQGEARGTWFFEGSFSVVLIDEGGKELARAVAKADTNWMTENFVPFTAKLQFTQPTSSTGVLVFEKDNPSGLPENADEFRLPVKFK
jgi:hypothetical protein